jgi:2-polyprenyl-3-methyl-5-hydroxy-6-metoxy-1,4-benzoquinol methylase
MLFFDFIMGHEYSRNAAIDDHKRRVMPLEFEIEDLGSFRRLHTKGPHTHVAAKGAEVCEECHVDLPFGKRFIEQMIEWDDRGVFHFIGERLCNDEFNAAPRRLIDRFCSTLDGFTVLDFGSGLGQLSPFFFERGASRVILTEIDDKLLELSRTYMKDHGRDADCTYLLVEEDDELEEIQAESVDLIVAAEVFEHILPRHRPGTMLTLYRKLKPGGIIVITSPNRLFPKDMHTTGLWFAAWLPAGIGGWYARTFASWRWKDRSTEDLLRQGLRQYSYFEARKVLRPLGMRDLCSEFPVQDRGLNGHRSLKGRMFHRALNVCYTLALSRLGPWEAWQPSLELAWAKPMKGDGK